ncbi:MAG: M48 family metalloprotease, partial [Desulfobacterales bacterium]|nr:M48 family metalloprotease [Desulfobacterales bacterium]
QYLVQKDLFTDVELTTEGRRQNLHFTASHPGKEWIVDIQITAEENIQVDMTPMGGAVPDEVLSQIKEDLILAVQLFEEKVRKTTLYFAWVPEEEIEAEKIMERRKNIIYRIFTDSMHIFFIISIAISIIFFIISIAISILFFIFLGLYAPVAIVAIQFILILFSDRLILRIGDWRITEKNPKVHLFQHHLPIEEYKDFQDRYSSERLTEIKSEIYEKTLAVGKTIDCETTAEVLSRHGFECIPENMTTKIVNVYQIVKNAAGKFGLPVPKIVLANNILPNAAASGPGPSRGVILITTGLLVQLEEDEILNVVGHELSHLKGRDPIVLFGLSAAEYLIRFYVFLNLFLSSFLFGYLYLFFALTGVFFIAKFFEGRADLEAAAKMGQPKVLAEALRKIGFRRLQLQRKPAYKFQGWIKWDPHPPIYFRIARLEGLEDLEKVKHPLIKSAQDNIRALIEALS